MLGVAVWAGCREQEREQPGIESHDFGSPVRGRVPCVSFTGVLKMDFSPVELVHKAERKANKFQGADPDREKAPAGGP